MGIIQVLAARANSAIAIRMSSSIGKNQNKAMTAMIAEKQNRLLLMTLLKVVC